MLVASTIGAVAKSLGNLCENHGGHVTYFEQGKSLLKQLIDGKHEVLMVELNFIEGEHRDLITRIRAKKQLQDLFVVVYAPAEMSKEEQARANGVNRVERNTARATGVKRVKRGKRREKTESTASNGGSNQDKRGKASANGVNRVKRSKARAKVFNKDKRSQARLIGVNRVNRSQVKNI